MSQPPRMRALPARKTAILSALDIGTSKVVCLIARLDPIEAPEALRGRTHRCRILGIGHQRSAGLKGGVIVDLEAAEGAIRRAVDAAERMAGVQVESVIVNITGGGWLAALSGGCPHRRPRCRRIRCASRSRGLRRAHDGAGQCRASFIADWIFPRRHAQRTRSERDDERRARRRHACH